MDSCLYTPSPALGRHVLSTPGSSQVACSSSNRSTTSLEQLTRPASSPIALRPSGLLGYIVRALAAPTRGGRGPALRPRGRRVSTCLLVVAWHWYSHPRRVLSSPRRPTVRLAGGVDPPRPPSAPDETTWPTVLCGAKSVLRGRPTTDSSAARPRWGPHRNVVTRRQRARGPPGSLARHPTGATVRSSSRSTRKGRDFRPSEKAVPEALGPARGVLEPAEESPTGGSGSADRRAALLPPAAPGKDIRRTAWWLAENFPRMPIVMLMRHPCAVVPPASLSGGDILDEPWRRGARRDYLLPSRGASRASRDPFERPRSLFIARVRPLRHFSPGFCTPRILLASLLSDPDPS